MITNIPKQKHRFLSQIKTKKKTPNSKLEEKGRNPSGVSVTGGGSDVMAGSADEVNKPVTWRWCALGMHASLGVFIWLTCLRYPITAGISII